MNDLPEKSINFLLYHSETAKINVQVIVGNETVWLSQKAMAELFGCSTDNISLHLKNIFNDNELEANSVTEEFSVTAADGKNYNTKFYNLDAIISVGYRVNSTQATQFRIWATKTLKEYIIKGFVIDSERLKQGGSLFGKDYFDELLEKIREIRASERRFYQKITDIYTLSIDYVDILPALKGLNGDSLLLRSQVYITITCWFLLLTALQHDSLHRLAPDRPRVIFTF